VVTIDDYYHNKKTQAIEKKTPKRKMETIEVGKDVPERSIKWKVGQDNAL